MCKRDAMYFLKRRFLSFENRHVQIVNREKWELKLHCPAKKEVKVVPTCC